VLTLRPQNNGDDSSGWHVNSVRMEPYVVHPSALVRVGTQIQILTSHFETSCHASLELPPGCVQLSISIDTACATG
jgi:hypothetical protein